ncbi:MAG: hypothetical protein O7H39_05425, partial [Gammaproteobacteria bacterium]|nr:hypothetical protein [Gammaproteobacteria bacterium]
VSESAGILHIRSAYDFDGVDVADIPAMRDPGVTLAADRPARFVRFVKPVSFPDDDILDIDNTAFGRSRNQLMRETLGYARIEPDGSIKAKLPANVSFAISVLDADGRRTTSRHNNWIQLRPGEERECTGCHTRVSQAPHGRLNAEPVSVNPGAPADGQPFPNSEPALFADAGETMAETFARINGVPNVTMDIIFEDVWTDPMVRAKDTSFSYAYAALSTTPPVDPGCITSWNATCRITVNYETHVHPIWGVPRITLDAMGLVLQDDTCTSCHGPKDAADATQVPAAQLDLTDGQSPDEADHYNSYRELLFDDNQQEVVNDVLIDLLVQDTDGNGNLLFQTDGMGNLVLDVDGNPIPVLITVNVGPSISVGGALASPDFFDRFAIGGTHAGRLTSAELKLLSEWTDVGAQYYNNPFDVPP